MAKIRIRNPEQWYGDYLAAVGAVRIGEKRIIELCDKYGAATIKAFLAEWQDYSRRRMADEIGKLPRRSWEATNAHDPIEGLAPTASRSRSSSRSCPRRARSRSTCGTISPASRPAII
ncbi:hydantoinase B/oxoprolinase family protein [Rhizorhabdus histidinilytica]